MARRAAGVAARSRERHTGRPTAVRSVVAGPGRPSHGPAARCLRGIGWRGVVMSGGGLQYERLQEQLLKLRLMESVDRLPSLLEGAAKRELSYSDFLEELLSAELAGKQDRNTTMRIRMAHFPFKKALETFDFKFQLIARRYERGSIILTSNQSLSGWGEVFGDPIIATAILDRLLHHSTMLNVKGESYRLKEKRKAGVFGRITPTTPAVDPLLG